MSFRAAGALVGELGPWGPRDVLGLWEPWWRIGYGGHGPWEPEEILGAMRAPRANFGAADVVPEGVLLQEKNFMAREVNVKVPAARETAATGTNMGSPPGARGGGVFYAGDLLGGWSALREGGTWG